MNASLMAPAERDSSKAAAESTTWRARAQARWPTIRNKLPRDLAILAWLAVLAQSIGVAWVTTDSVHTTVALVLKGASVRPGELAVFAYSGGQIAGYYDDQASWRRLFDAKASLAGPSVGDGFVKYLVGVPGDRIEVSADHVYLHTARGRLDMGRCKPVSRGGAPLASITEQVIPEGQVYVWAPHVDALDSRYAVMGLVPMRSIVGRAVRLW